MLLINVDPSQWSDDMHPEYMTFTQQIIESGEFVSGDPLAGPDAATTVRVRDGAVAATDGPYVESKEHVGGYYVVDVKDLDRAIELAAKIPDARTGGIEVRPILDLAM
jgi:hypothetical protein